jgi:hypothetical protein
LLAEYCGCLVANTRIRAVNDTNDLTAQIALDVGVNGKQLHTRIAEYQIGMFFGRLEQREIGVSSFVLLEKFYLVEKFQTTNKKSLVRVRAEQLLGKIEHVPEVTSLYVSAMSAYHN